MKLPLPGPVRRSLRLKLILVSIGVEVLMLALLVGNSLRLLNHTMDTEVRERAQEIQPLLQAALSARLFQRDYVSTREILNQILSSDRDGLRYVVVLDAGGRVVKTCHMTVQPYDTPDGDLLSYDSDYPAQFAIELKGGTLGELHLSPGDRVNLPLARLKARAR